MNAGNSITKKDEYEKQVQQIFWGGIVRGGDDVQERFRHFVLPSDRLLQSLALPGSFF